MGFFKSITKSLKKAAPVIGAAIGYGLGGPAGGALYSAIGGGIGGLAAGQSVDEALKTAAISGIAGYGIGQFAGNTAAAPGFLRAGAAPAAASAPLSTAATSTSGLMTPGQAAATLGQKVGATLPAESSGIFGLIKEYPLSSATIGLTTLGAVGAFDEEEEEGGTPRPFPVGEQLDINVIGEDGEILNLKDSDDARRYRESLDNANRRAAGGEVKGPGTGTSDSVPARLSDGEFVVTAKAVRGAGGGNRDIGAARMYDMMADLEAVG
tara:strand:+ start:55 stop:855 length:801 start_codon:yes stop_codon:yes gene_type:complete